MNQGYKLTGGCFIYIASMPNHLDPKWYYWEGKKQNKKPKPHNSA